MNLFFNSVQRRIRAAWRLVVLAVLFLLPALLTVNTLPRVLRTAWDGAVLPFLGVINGVLLVALMVVLFWLAARFLDRRPLREYGFHFSPTWWRDLIFGLVLGAALMLAIFLIERAAGWITVRGTFVLQAHGVSVAGALVLGALSYVCVGIYEEAFARGYLLRNLAEGLNGQPIAPRGALLLAYLLSSVLFGLAHQGGDHATALTTPFLALNGLFLGLGYLLTRELALPIGLHISWNFFQGYVFGFPVSGSGHEAAVFAIRQGGSTAWTGGAWGPEGGLIGLLALLAGSLAVIAWVRLTRGAVRVQDSLATYESPAPAVGGTRAALRTAVKLGQGAARG